MPPNKKSAMTKDQYSPEMHRCQACSQGYIPGVRIVRDMKQNSQIGVEIICPVDAKEIKDGCAICSIKKEQASQIVRTARLGVGEIEPYFCDAFDRDGVYFAETMH